MNEVEEIMLSKIITLVAGAKKEWVRGWKTNKHHIGRNYVEDVPYKGVNALMTSSLLLPDTINVDGEEVQRSNYWITLNQAYKLGGRLKSCFCGNSEEIKVLQNEIKELNKSLFALRGDERQRVLNEIVRIQEEITNLSPKQSVVKFVQTVKDRVRKDENGNWVPVTTTVENENGELVEVVEKYTKYSTMYYTVYPIECFEGLKKLPNRLDKDLTGDTIADEEIQNIIESYCARENIELVYEGDVASYSDELDRIRLPKIELFHNENKYYHTAFHEMIHSTRHESRLNRTVENQNDGFSKEELTAEIGSLFLMQNYCIFDEEVFENSIAYLQRYINRITSSDDLTIVFAAQNAEKAKNYIIGKNQD